MGLALVYCPYLASGEMPPLGLASISGALRQAGHECVPFDFSWLAYTQEPPFLHHLRQIANVGQAGRRVQFVFHPELLLCHLFGRAVLGPAFDGLLSPNPVRRQAEAASVDLAADAVRRWSAQIGAAQPDAVFFSAYISNLVLTLPLAMAVKRSLGVPVVLGGPGVGLPEVQDFVLRLPADPALPLERGRAVDAIVVREGEVTAVELAARLADVSAGGRMRTPGWQATLAAVPGVAVLDESGRRCLSERPLCRSLDDLPRPSFAGLPMPGVPFADYGDPHENRFACPDFHGSPVATTRGCVNHCSYCSESAFWQRFRQRSVASVMAELDQRHAETGAREFLFCESALNGNRAWLMEFCAAATGRGYEFNSFAIAAKGTDAELAGAMARAGFRGLRLGVETFCERTRQSVGKHLSRADVDEALASFTAAGMRLMVYVLCGFPGETEADHEEAARGLAEWVQRDTAKLVQWNAGHPVRLEPYSPYWLHPDRFGISIRPYTIELPSALEYLAAPLGRLTFTWDAGVSEAEVGRRCARLRAIATGASSQPRSPFRQGSTVSPILRRCLRLVSELDLPAPCRRDLVAALQAHPETWINQWQYAGLEAGLDREELIWRGVALHFLGSALDLCDDMMTGQASYVPSSDAALILLHLSNGFVHALARSTVSPAGVARATRLLCDALRCRHTELDRPAPDEERYSQRARDAGGRRVAACLRILWDGTPFETEAEAAGEALGLAAFVLADLEHHAARLRDLPAAAARRVVEQAATAAAQVEAGSACMALSELAGLHVRLLTEVKLANGPDGGAAVAAPLPAAPDGPSA